ncbi:MAG: hypothetical protein WEE36_01875 [Acidimicrobiia bacterium]
MKRVTLAVLLVLVGACGDDDGGSSTSTSTAVATTTTGAPTTTTESVPAGLDAAGQVAEATVVRQFLFDTVTLWGEAALDPEALAEGIVSVYPISVRGSAVAADPDGISIAINSVDSKDVASSDNPWVVAFTVADTSGACVGGLVYGFPAPDTTVEVDLGTDQECRAGVVYDMAADLIEENN